MTAPRADLLYVLLFAVLAGACAPAQATPGPASPAEGEPFGPVIGCISIEAAECQFVAEHVIALLPAERGPAFAVEIWLDGCEHAVPCPRTLAVREGRAIVDYPDGGEPIEISLAGPPQAPRIAVQAGNFWSGPAQPSSARVAGIGPFPFDLGHCGLSHVVDFDGSFWVPIGQVDGDAPGIINGESGQMRLIGPNLAQYTGRTGFVAQLARFPGPKRFFFCD